MRNEAPNSLKESSLGISSRPKLRAPKAAEYLGVSASYLNKTRVYGRGPTYIKLPGGTILYDMDDLDRWLDKHRRNSTSECAA